MTKWLNEVVKTLALLLDADNKNVPGAYFVLVLREPSVAVKYSSTFKKLH